MVFSKVLLLVTLLLCLLVPSHSQLYGSKQKNNYFSPYTPPIPQAINTNVQPIISVAKPVLNAVVEEDFLAPPQLSLSSLYKNLANSVKIPTSD